MTIGLFISGKMSVLRHFEVQCTNKCLLISSNCNLSVFGADERKTSVAVVIVPLVSTMDVNVPVDVDTVFIAVFVVWLVRIPVFVVPKGLVAPLKQVFAVAVGADPGGFAICHFSHGLILLIRVNRNQVVAKPQARLFCCGPIGFGFDKVEAAIADLLPAALAVRLRNYQT